MSRMNRETKRWLCSAFGSTAWVGFFLYTSIFAGWADWSSDGHGPGSLWYAAVGAVATFVAFCWAVGSWYEVFSRLRTNRHRARTRWRKIYTVNEGLQICVYVEGGDFSQPNKLGVFDLDQEDEMMECIANAQKKAEQYKEGVLAAERLSQTLNRGM